ncbi:uncharacterized protein A1O9_07205 [Exophiala aquamarina CBS 119918]|uniref:Uncharacterized protein n=1 Tax=Exophiala aquamarina CBS 119918 TaxID=1182545 RepID=A0A072PN98_9EURO|nr:uncharacterized protein A1O9_07205 [Exophiala aquamarina CBS 119918]KEF57015.1 hypothetical protein A1O9_07205 [Exophiala aquamarina CBS 119918]
MTSLPYHHSPLTTPKREITRSSAGHLAPYLRVLGLSGDEYLDEVDDKYFELVSTWGGPKHPGSQKFARMQLDAIDEAYQAILPRLMDAFASSDAAHRYSMKNLETAHDRIQASSQDDNSFWIHADVPPRDSPPHRLSPDHETSDNQRNDIPSDYPTFHVNEIRGDLLDAPDGATIIHAVNCQGLWGFGVAKQLKTEFPGAFKAYQSYCETAKRPRHLAGKCLLIPPQIEDYQDDETLEKKASNGKPDPRTYRKQPCKQRRWIACLLTSVGYGTKNMRFNNPGRDSPERILRQTQMALESLRTQLEDYTRCDLGEHDEYAVPGDLWTCKFNSGAFGVDWEETLEIVESEFEGFDQPLTVVARA